MNTAQKFILAGAALVSLVVILYVPYVRVFEYPGGSTSAAGYRFIGDLDGYSRVDGARIALEFIGIAVVGVAGFFIAKSKKA